jgi:hypothetical protein
MEHESEVKLFRFQDLEVWQRSADLAIDFNGIADQLDINGVTVTRSNFAQQQYPFQTTLRKVLAARRTMSFAFPELCAAVCLGMRKHVVGF